MTRASDHFLPRRAHGATRRRSGVAMLLVIIALAVAAILSLTFLRSSGPTMAIASNNDRKAKARAIAESGLAMAVKHVQSSTDWRTDNTSGEWMSDIAIDGGTITVFGVDEDGDLTDDNTDAVNLSVVATFEGVTHRVSARVTAATGSTKNLLLIAGNGSSPSATDREKRDLFESWGYTVTLLDDRASQSAYDAALVGQDVVYVSEEVSSGNVNSKLRSTTLGVVNDEPFLHDDFRVSTGHARHDNNTTSIDIADNSHYITSVFSVGTLEIYNTSDRVRSNSYAQALGTEVLADGPGLLLEEPVLMVTETDAMLTLGTAAGRRVMFPAGDRFRVTNLTEDGLTLLQRSLEWAASGGTPDADEPILVAHYEFDPVMLEPILIGHWRLDDTATGTGGAVRISGDLTLYNSSYLDAYNSDNGDYGPLNRRLNVDFATNTTGNNDITINGGTVYANVAVGNGADPNNVIRYYNGGSITGTTSAQSVNAEIINYDAPPGFGSHTGHQTYNGGSTTWSSDKHFNNVTLNNGAQVRVSGDVSVRVSGTLTLNDGDIVLNPGATLTLWGNKNITINNGSTINNDTSRPSDLTLIQYGNNRNLTINQGIIVGAVHVASDLTINNGSEIYGSVIAGDDITINNGAIHADTATSPPSDGSSLSPPVARDETDHNNDGTVNGALGGQAGPIGNAFFFDGSDDYVEFPHLPEYALDGGTFACWFNTDTLSGRQGLFSKDSTDFDTGGHFSVFIENNRVRVRMQSTSASYWVESGTIQTDRWYHIMFAWGAGGMVLYLDGVEVDTNPYVGGLSTTSGGTGNFEPIVLGGNAWQSGNLVANPVKDFFSGYLDDLRIYSERLTAEQAIDLFDGYEPSPQASEAIIADTSGFGDPLDLGVADTSRVTWADGMMTFDDETIAQSLGAATKITDAIQATGEFTAVIRFTPADPGTTSIPSRLLSMSSSSAQRNFMLGQDGSAYSVRLRTTSTGSSGTIIPDYESGDVLDPAEPVVLIITYDGVNLKTYRNASVELNEPVPGLLDSWDGTMPLLLGNEIDASHPWLGTIDELAIYNRAFTAAQAGSVTGDGTMVTGGSVVWDELE